PGGGHMSERRPHRFPRFSSPDEERVHLKQRMAAAFRLFDKFGFDEGVAGHLTGRDPEHPDLFWVNPFGLSFGLIRASDLVLVDREGNVVEGDWPVNRAAFAIHSQVHAARPDVNAAAHTHSIHGRAFSTLRRPLAPLTQDACALGSHKAVILRNHGLLTVGRTVDEAAWWFITMERSCQVQLAAEAAGTPVAIDHDVAELTRSQVGTPQAGWLNFQPLYDKIVAEQPD